MKSLLALLAWFLLGMSSLPVAPPETTESVTTAMISVTTAETTAAGAGIATFDIAWFWNIFVSVLQEFSTALGGPLQQFWTWLMTELPASTVLWFTLAMLTTVGYGLSTLSVKVCKVLMLVSWVLFFLFLFKEELHI